MMQQLVPVLSSSMSMVCVIFVIIIIIYTSDSPVKPTAKAPVPTKVPAIDSLAPTAKAPVPAIDSLAPTAKAPVPTIDSLAPTGQEPEGDDNKKCQEKYGRDKAFFDQDGSCYVCEEARPDRGIFSVTSEKACEGTIEKIKSAHLKNSKITQEDSKRMFHDPLAETVAICPEGTSRNLSSIFSETPCTGICSDLYGSSSFENWTTGDCFSCEDGKRNAELSGSGKECSRECEPGYAGDPNGTCFKCPDGTARTLFGDVNSEHACDKFLVPNSGTRAVVSKPWVYPWTSNGSNLKPLQFKESNYSPAEKLGPL